LPAEVRAHLVAVREQLSPLEALRDLNTGLEATLPLKMKSDVLGQLPENVRLRWRGLEGLQEIGDTLAGRSRMMPGSAKLSRCLTDVHAATGNSRLTGALKDALIAKAERMGQGRLAKALRDLQLESIPPPPSDPADVPVPSLVPEAPAGTRAGQSESVWEGLPELKDSATKASQKLSQQLKAEVRWHSEFDSSLAYAQVYLALHLHRQTERDERRAQEKRRDSLTAVEPFLSRRLTPAERIIAADMLRRGRSAEAVKKYLQRPIGK
jgi:hypothetical protein